MHRLRHATKNCVVALLGSLLSLLPGIRAHGQETRIIRDGSIGPGVDVQPEIRVEPGAGLRVILDEALGVRPGGGPNVFQSFERFDVGRGDSAIFRADRTLPTENIIARVTGGNASQILGTLASEVPGASLFLLNPTGIVLGAGASLDVPGSVHLSTATSLEFVNGEHFSALGDRGAISLSIAPPQAFGFLPGQAPAPIQATESGLIVSGAGALSLVGGDIEIRSTFLQADSGPILIGAVSPGSTVSIAGSFASDFRTTANHRTGGRLLVRDTLIGSRGRVGGGIQLFGGSVDLEESAVLNEAITRGAPVSILAGDRLRIAGGLVANDGVDGGITLGAERIELGAGVHITARSAGSGAGSGLAVAGRTIEVLDSQLLSLAAGEGRGGDLVLQASDSIEIRRSDVVTEARSATPARGGDTRISAPRLTFAEASRIGTRTFGSGVAGDLKASAARIHVLNSVLGSESDEFASGRTGNVQILGDDVSISTGSLIGVRAGGPGDSSDVELRAGTLRVEFSQLENSTNEGDGGSISISANRLDTRNLDIGAISRSGGRSSDIRFQVDTLVFTGVIATQAPQGVAGKISIDAHRARFGPGLAVILSAGAVTSDESGIEIRADQLELSRTLVTAGDRNGRFGGDLRLSVRSLSLDDATLTARNRVEIEAQQLSLRTGSVIGSESGLPLLAEPAATSSLATAPSGLDVVRAPAGDVRIVADRIELDGGSRISSTTFSDGDAGDVEVQARDISLSNEASIDSRSAGRLGDAGTLRIRAESVSIASGSRIATSSNGPGAAGSIELAISDQLTLDGSRSAASVTESGLPTAPHSLDRSAQPESTPRTAEISSSLLPDPSLLTGPLTGDAGQILIRAPRVRLQSGAQITSSNAGSGRAGSVTIEADRIDLTESRISTDATLGSDRVGGADGNIRLSARDRIQLDGARVTASVDSGRGGDISLQSDSLLLLRNESQVLAQTVAGNGGAIRIGGETVLRDETSRISADAGVGQAGTIEVNAPERNLDAEIAVVEAAYVDPVDRIRPGCELLGQNENSLSLRTRRWDSDAEVPTEPAATDRDAAMTLATPNVSTGPRSRPTTGAAATRSKLEGRAEPPELDNARSRVLDSRSALRAGEFDRALTLMESAEAQLDRRESDVASVLLRVQLASSALELSRQTAEVRALGLLRAHRLLHEAIEQARALSDPRLSSLAYGLLGRTYQADRRIEEALYLTRRASLAADEAGAIEIRYRWHWQEAGLLWSLGRKQESLAAYRRAIADLDPLTSSLSEDRDQAARTFRREVEPVYLELADRLLQRAEQAESQGKPSEEFVIEARNTVERWRAAELRNYFRDDCSTRLEADTAELDRVAGNAAVVYPIVFPDRLELLVRFPTGLQRFRVAVPELELEQMTTHLRRSVQDLLTRGYERPARALYRWLVEPYRAILESQGIDTLIFVPGPRLRTIPLAALHDGNQFLIQSYALAVTPGLSLVDPRPLDRTNARILLAGVSESVQDFEALPVVPRELEGIRQVFGGEVLLDAAFSPTAMDRSVSDNRPTILHIASHVMFTGDPRDSFVLTHSAKLSLDRFAEIISRTRYRRDPLELLVLSACRTALDDPQAGLGLAGIAIRSGARSAVGSLWDIEDESSSELVVEFYRQLKDPSHSRAEALRRAQLSLLEDPELSHPFYWSAFVLVNNWL